jgi:hypothetical protein
MTWMNLQPARDRVCLQNQMECLLEQMRIKVSILVKNELLSNDIVQALARGETDPSDGPRDCNAPRRNWSSGEA